MCVAQLLLPPTARRILRRVRRLAWIGVLSCATAPAQYQGAEVIVPNADLISDQIINWTLSDLTRRIEIPLSLDGDIEPERVIELVQRAVTEVPGIERSPAPACILTGIVEGDVNFELRVWVRTEDWPIVRGAALLAVHRSLSAAGIVLPLPELGVHLRSVDPAAAEQLAALLPLNQYQPPMPREKA